ncbi:hypothetical protein GLOIN_2v583658 [Rhizophagus clarus]|uniref:Crinkler effector protein N-terminal domain-containing protein n=1 Tax=Rhizophagus clarus TaxID=94130 RepID=A0A8H3QV05_9GLOM|nr:hypothetical protein GLOIN_2v583658 [Rhizophagus clarus]
MMLSLNCLILGRASEKSFTEDIGEEYDTDDKVKIKFVDFKVSHLKEKLFRRQIIKDITSSSEYIDLWKVDGKKVNEEENNLKEFTESDIKEKLGGVKMVGKNKLKSYFIKMSEEEEEDIHVFIVSTTTAGPSQQGVPQGPNWNDASSVYSWIQTFQLNRGRNRLVTSFGMDFEFCGRDDTIDILWNGNNLLNRNGIVERFKYHGDREKEHHPIPVVACGPGTGKSRFLDEVEELLKRNVDDLDDPNNKDNEDIQKIRNAFKNMVVINTTYGNGSPAKFEDLIIVQIDDDQVINAETSLAIRILYEYFRPKHNYGRFSFSDFRSLCKKHSTISEFTLNTALQVVHTDTVKQKETLIVLVLGIDEFNKLHDVHKGACKALVNSIGGMMLDSQNIFFIPIMAGTIEGPLEEYITESRYKQLRLPLYLLDRNHATEIGKTMGLIDEKYGKLHPYFQVSIGDVGGHVRTLEYFYEFFEREMETKDPDKKDPYKVEINHIMHQVEAKISYEYGLGSYSRWLTEVLAKAILNLPVNKDDKIKFNGKSTSYRDLSSMGLINLVLADTTT